MLKAQKKPTPSPFVLAGARSKRLQAEAAATFEIHDFLGHDLQAHGREPDDRQRHVTAGGVVRS